MTSDSETEPKYEFSEQQNTLIRSLSSFMKAASILFIVFGGLMAIGAFLSPSGRIMALLQAALAIVLGVLQYRASAAFRSVVTTQGSDIRYLMDALGNLRNTYKLGIIVSIIVLVGALILAALVVGQMGSMGARTPTAM